MASSAKKPDMAANLSKLSLSASAKSSKSATKSKAKKPVADSWEDEDESDSDQGDQGPASSLPSAPPPTPISPSYNPALHFASLSETTSQWRPDGLESSPARRPEKTDAVARRMIAAGLGVKVPKMTDEQKAYDKSVREQERKRRDNERAAEKKKEEDAEKAKAAIWGD